MKRRFLGITLLWVMVAVLTGCGLFWETYLSETFTMDVDPQATFYVNLYQGDVRVEVSDDETIKVEYYFEVKGDDLSKLKAYAADMKLTASTIENDSAVRLEGTRPAGSTLPQGITTARINVKIKVPHTLVEYIDIKTSTGDINVIRFDGELYATTSNGYIQLNDVSGYMNLTTSNGTVKGTGLKGDLIAKTSNGLVDIDANELQIVDINTSNNRVTFRGRIVENGEVNIETSNGSIDFRVPVNSAFNITAATSNAKIDCVLDYQPAGAYSETNYDGMINGGGNIYVNLETSNADIMIRGL